MRIAKRIGWNLFFLGLISTPAISGCGKSSTVTTLPAVGPGKSISPGSDDHESASSASSQFLGDLTAKKVTLAQFTPAFKKAIAPIATDAHKPTGYNGQDADLWLKSQQSDAPSFEEKVKLLEGDTLALSGEVKGKQPPEYFALRMRKVSGNWQVEWFQRSKVKAAALPPGNPTIPREVAQSFLNALLGGEETYTLADASLSPKFKAFVADPLPSDQGYSRSKLKNKFSVWRGSLTWGKYADGYKLTTQDGNSFKGELTLEGKSRPFMLTVEKDPSGEWYVTKFEID